MIEAKNLKKVYKTKKGVVVNALDNVSVKLPDTGMVFILGKSGSGKSTLLNVLGGLDSFDGGEIIIKGTSSKDFKQSHYDSYRNTYIGFIFQEYNVLEELTVGANVALAIELQGRKATDEEVSSILKEVDLEGFGNRKPNELSGGQKQRVAIARALVKKPEIIMADEPTGALDSATGKQVFDTLKKLSRDKLVLIVSHDREFSEQYADRIIELKDGVIISDVEKSSSNEMEEIIGGDDDSITFGESEITVKPGYTITEEDRIAINEYLSALSTGAKIKLGGKKEKKKVTSGDFAPTDESKIKSNKLGDFKLIKSKLSMKNAFKLGSGGLNHKKIRLVFTILLSLVSFTLFGLADTIAAYNNISTATSSIYDTGVSYASYAKMIKRGSGDYEYWRGDNTYLTPEDIELIKTQTGRNVIGVYKNNGDSFSFSQNLGDETVEGMEPSILYSSSFSGVTAIDENLISEHGFTLLGNSRLPEPGKNEIVISKYVYDYFSKVGHVAFTNEGQVESEIKSENDLIGKTITFNLTYNDSNEYTIVGIVDTNFDTSRYEKLAASDAQFTVSAIESMALTAELESAQKYSFACVGFVNPKMLSDIIASSEGKAENLDGSGSIALYEVLNDNVNHSHELYGDKGESNNILNSFYFNSVYSLSNIKDNVIWIGSPIESLGENQVIVSVDALRNLVSQNTHYSVVFYDTSKLVGFEKTLFEMHQSGEVNINYYPDLRSHFNNAKYYTAFSYAYNNVEAAKAAYAARVGIDVSEIENWFGNFNAEFYNSFAQMAEYEGAFSDIITDTAVTEYTNGLIGRYGLSSMIMPEALKDMLTVKFTYNGKEYYSYDPTSLILTIQYNENSDDIVARRYAAENFTDALNYYKLARNIQDVDLPNVNVSDVLGTYSDYLRFNHKPPEGFVPAATVDFEVYQTRIFVEFYKSSAGTSKLVLSANSYFGGSEKFIKNIEIVGVIAESNNNNFGNYMGNTIVVAESIINSILGANRGGIYSYAVGVMPSDKLGINEIVKFSKTYISEAGDVKFSLKNNVMEQLGMVDEILDILGQVFLYVGIGFAVFASLMLTNFISTSITHKKQEIGILRAIGSRSNDVFRIFFAESFIIAMINYVLSIAGTLTVTIIINKLLREDAGMLITFLNFGIRQIGVLLLVSLGVAFIATFLPVKKIASMKPIDAIKNRK